MTIEEEKDIPGFWGMTFRQLQRDRVLFFVVQPIYGVMQLLALVYIWLSMELVAGIVIMIVLAVLYNIAAWIFDKRRLLQLWRTQESKTKDAEVTDAQIDLHSARMAKYMKYTEAQLDDIIDESKKVLGII